ncbi:hypothetical protein H9638_16250 [Arthrobacter sp. Sa2BUA2]|uniref:Uncharacterized protein n=1 Tax=Arthrobacter pullicola TaxID=2762224 RepID=A0ABR8YM76_9MICC|nr:hypothetical protein [Arthrobacter pullicola]MBD8045360.1 hypothetical protein [Arthrobacter pullicola]
MKPALRAALPILAVVLLATAVVTVGGLPNDQTSSFPVTGALVALIAGLAANLRWKHIPWLPTAAMLVAAGGYLVNHFDWMRGGFFAVVALLAWHGLQREKTATDVHR